MTETATPTAEETTQTEDRPLTVDELREKQLDAGKVTGRAKTTAERRMKGTPAEQRSHPGAQPIGGRIDNMTRRDDSDVLDGHFCVIDFAHPKFGADAVKAVELIIGEGNAHAGSGDYGVYLGPGELDNTGYPLTGTVLLRDEHAAQVPNVPYGALRPAQAGGRR